MTTTAPAPRRTAPRRRRRLLGAALLFLTGVFVLTFFAYPGHTLVTRMYKQGVAVDATTVAVTTGTEGRPTRVTVRFRKPEGGAPVTADLAGAPPLPRAVEGRPIEVTYDSKDTSDVLSRAQMGRLAPEWHALGVGGTALMVIGTLVALTPSRRTREAA
ncbi:hypothetical protein [Streptomyces sp. NRRL B-1347]|uniref:hypothetical protein n=1 Tax=Streptomyces sp. NRRL B-1347 TaxID=1476877 RepID=UPI0004C906C4|nr:hypothetical protein [Streptomyces sp. NRRL B-1347]